MNKWLFLLVFLLSAWLGFAYMSGYRFHPENLHYYYQISAKGQKQEILFRDGKKLEGVIVDETNDEIKIDVDGASVIFSRSSIASIQAVKGDSPWAIFYANYKKYEKVRPLIAKDASISFDSKIDQIMERSSRAGEQTGQGGTDTAKARLQEMAEKAQAVKEQAHANQARIDAELSKMEGSG